MSENVMKLYYFTNGWGQTYTVIAANEQEAKDSIRAAVAKEATDGDQFYRKYHSDILENLDKWFDEAEVKVLEPNQVLFGEIS